jgi:hypothetical protein
MRHFPDNYQRLHDFNHNRLHVWHMIDANLLSIKNQVERLHVQPEDDERVKCFTTRIDRLTTFFKHGSIRTDDLDYLREVLVRVNCYIETKGIDEENNTQLKLLLNHQVAGILDRDIVDALFYGVGSVLMASIAVLAVVGALAFAMANLPMTMVVLPSFALLGLGVAFLDSDHDEEAVGAIFLSVIMLGVSLCVAPGLFFLTAGTYLAACAVFMGGACGANVCANNTSLATHTYALKSDVNALMTTGFFAEEPVVDDDSSDEGYTAADFC